MDEKEREKHQDLTNKITNVGDIVGLMTLAVGGHTQFIGLFQQIKRSKTFTQMLMPN